MSEDKRIVVEIFSHPEAEALRKEIQQMEFLHQQEIKRLESRLEGLHRTFYEYLDAMRKKR